MINYLIFEYFLKGKISIKMRVSRLFLHKLQKDILRYSQITDWLKFTSAFSIFLENEISHITKRNKQLKFLEICIMGYLALT